MQMWKQNNTILNYVSSWSDHDDKACSRNYQVISLVVLLEKYFVVPDNGVSNNTDIFWPQIKNLQVYNHTFSID